MACAITITSQVGSNRSIVVQTYLDRDAPRRDYDVLLDKLTSSVDRQEAKLQLEALTEQLVEHEKRLHELKEDFARIEVDAEKAWTTGRKKGPYVPGDKEAGQKNNVMVNIGRWETEIKKIKASIIKAQAIAALGANDED